VESILNDATFPPGTFSMLVHPAWMLESAFEERAPGGHAFLQTVFA